MKNVFYLILIFSFSSFLFISCEENNSPDKFETTPYELNIPSSLPQPVLPSDNPLTKEGVLLD